MNNQDVNVSVFKQLSPEEVNLITAMQNTCAEILAGSAGEVATEPTPPEAGKQAQTPSMTEEQKAAAACKKQAETTPPTEEEKKKEAAAVKKVESTTPGETASPEDPAVQQIQDQQPESNDAVAMLTKALLSVLQPQSVQKAVQPVNPVIDVMNSQNSAIKAINDKVDMLANGFAQLLDGMGVVKQIKIAQDEQVAKSQAPVAQVGNSELVKFFEMALKSAHQPSQPSYNPALGQADEVRKSVANITGLFDAMRKGVR